MKRETAHLAKYQFVLNSQLQKHIKQIAISQQKLEQEQRKYAMLQQCLLETRHNLQSQAKQSIQALQFQQYQQFIEQLEKAIQIQQEGLNISQKNHDKAVQIYHELKLKLNNLEDYIAKTDHVNRNHQLRIENQQNTEIYNLLRGFEL